LKPRRRPDLNTPEYRKARAELRALGLPCWLCGHAIRYDLKHPHPRSFSADHVVSPLKGGGHDGNLRASHLGCNSRRAALEQQGVRFDAQPEREW
jgi:hypothetical protein